MSKVTDLANLVDLQNETTAVTQINSNSHAIQLGFENTLSRDGSQPNSMNASFDMNSNKILNLPVPGSATEPLRLQDLSDFIGGGTISTIPVGGTTRQYLGKNSGTDLDVNWLSVREPADVRNFGVLGNGADDSDAMQAAIDSLTSTGGGVVYIPAGLTVTCTKPLAIDNGANITLLGDCVKNERSDNASTLIYSGTGPRFIDGRDSRGTRIEGLHIKYSSPSFTGNLVDFSAVTPGSTVSAFITVKNCVLEPNTERTGTATLLNVSGTVDALIEKNFFRHGAPAILGQVSANQSVRITIRENTFVKGENISISSGGESWLIEGNSFENSIPGVGLAFTNISTLPCHGMAWINNWFGDVTAATTGTNWIDGYFEGLIFTGNQMSGPIGIEGTGITLRNSNGIQINGNRFELLTNAINIATASTGIKMGANYYSNVTNAVANPTNATIDDFTLTSTGVTTLSTVNTNVGTFGSATQSPQYTVNGKGLITAASNVTITGTVPGGAAGGDLGGTYPNPTINNAPVIAKVLTGYTSGAGTVSASDSILSAIQKLNGNDATNANLTGDVTSVGNATTLAAGNAGNLNSGTLLAARMPAHTGDVTSSAGSVALTLAAGNAGNLNSGTLLAARMPALTGDVTTSAGAVATAIGATKVTSAMLNSDVFSTAHSWGGQQTFTAPVLGTPASGVATNLTGTASGLTAGTVTTNANLTGDVTSSGNATTLTNAPVIAKVLTGYSASAGTVASTDSLLQAFQKVGGLVDNAAWTTYTPTFSATTGTATTAGRYKQIGKTIFVNIQVTFTSAITGTFTVTVPVANNATLYSIIGGKEISGAGATGGNAGAGYVAPSGTTLNVLTYAGTQFLANGSTIILTGSYEAT